MSNKHNTLFTTRVQWAGPRERPPRWLDTL